MNEMIKADNLRVKDMIYEFNGVEVMLDTDLARLYGVETKRINEAVSRNKMKFPERYAFKISELEYRNLKSQFSTSSLKNNYGGARKGHIAFTEQGVYMLATILRSERATEVSIRIMDTFVKMRHYINYNNNLLPNRVLLLMNFILKSI